MTCIMLDGVCLPSPRRVDKLSHHQTRILNAIRICYSQRITLYRLDRPPDIDNLYTTALQLFGLFGQMVWDA